MNCWTNRVSVHQCLSISRYTLLIGSSYINLSVELRSSKKQLINIKNNNQKCFLWCHIKHINSIKIHPKSITEKNKKLVNDLNYDRIKFPILKEDFSKTEIKSNIFINFFWYKNKVTFLIYISDQKFENLMDLLLISDKDKSQTCTSKILKDKKILLQKLFTVFY